MKKLIILSLITLSTYGFAKNPVTCSIVDKVNPNNKTSVSFDFDTLKESSYLTPDGSGVLIGDVGFNFNIEADSDGLYVTIDYSYNGSGDELDQFSIDKNNLKPKKVTFKGEVFFLLE